LDGAAFLEYDGLWAQALENRHLMIDDDHAGQYMDEWRTRAKFGKIP